MSFETQYLKIWFYTECRLLFIPMAWILWLTNSEKVLWDCNDGIIILTKNHSLTYHLLHKIWCHFNHINNLSCELLLWFSYFIISCSRIDQGSTSRNLSLSNTHLNKVEKIRVKYFVWQISEYFYQIIHFWFLNEIYSINKNRGSLLKKIKFFDLWYHIIDI